MRCRITRINVHHDELMHIDVRDHYSDAPRSRARVEAEGVMVGDPREAHGLMHCNEELEIRPVERFEKAEAKVPVYFDHIQKGDEVRYQFIRGDIGKVPEDGEWMKVVRVEGDIITAVFAPERFGNRFMFRVLRCQIIEHRSKDGKNVKALPRKEEPRADIKVVEPNNGSIDALRKRVEEFNLE